jgi:cobalamin-dependent methionine synthase I
MSDSERLLQEIAVAQDDATLIELEHEADRLIEALADRLRDAIRERRDCLDL